jgi:hypothetical protein
MANDAPAPDDAPPPDGAPPLDRSPRDYRPDLRPMLILVALLFTVIVAWLFLSPLILPAT